ncbi:MAG: DUF4136 domain-containing protein [Pontiella sp.]
MKYATPLCLTALIALLSGCSSMKVTSEKSADFDYSAVQTYQWVPAPQKILDEDGTLLNESLQQALNRELKAHAWKEVLTTEPADLQVVYYIKLTEHEEYTGPADNAPSRLTGGFTYNKGSWGYKDQQPDLNVYTVEVGTVSLLLYNAKTGQKIWTGTLQTRLDRTTPLDQQQKKLHLIARKITDELPRK